MNHRSTRLTSLAGALAIVAGALVATPAMALCIALEESLPDPATPGAVVLLGTILAVDGIDTQLKVEAWYLGATPEDIVVVTGGRDPELMTSVDWTPTPGEQYVVVAMRAEDGTLTTATCEQAWPTPELLAALVTRYGEPVQPLPASSGAPSPGSSGSPVASPPPGSLVPAVPSASPS